MRSTFAAYALLASLIGIGTAGAAECPADALGVGRTIVVDPSEHALLGSFQYGESLPLRDREVVLTFDDGPLPPYTSRVLDTLASECVKATFFLVGRMVRANPSLVRRIYDEGHTVANHSQNHPFTFHRMTVDQASLEIEGGFESLRTVLGDPKAVAPFFRIPGLLRQSSVEQYLISHGYMTWSVDFTADDWTRISAQEVARRAVNRVEARGKGILLLHDIQPATALALPEILRELKARGFRIVHVVPSTLDRPKTVTEPEQWAVRRTVAPQQKLWPRTLVTMVEAPAPVLGSPSPASFGIENFGKRTITVALARTFERKVEGDGLRPTTPWPRLAANSVPPDVTPLPVPAAYNFRYVRPIAAASPAPTRIAAKKPPVVAVVSAKPKQVQTIGSLFGLAPLNRPRTVGHQLSVARPPGGATVHPR